MFIRRLNPEPLNADAPQCYSTYGCPDLWELADGDFAVIGADITVLAAQLPPGAGCAPEERMVKIPRRLLVGAKPHIPDSL